MKLLSLWVEATVKPPFVLLALIAILMIGTSDVFAYGDYAGCEGCHGDFRADPYAGPPGGTGWPTGSLHNIHRNDMLGGDCDTCHGSGSPTPVFLDSSNGGNGLSAISCVGCHGRDQDGGNDSVSGGLGAGLRQHHTEAGIPGCAGCHTDAVLANYTPEDENILPNYYANPGNNHPAMPTNSCNPAATAFVENFAGTALGLDNDGDGTYDMADVDCEGFPVELMTFEIE